MVNTTKLIKVTREVAGGSPELTDSQLLDTSLARMGYEFPRNWESASIDTISTIESWATEGEDLRWLSVIQMKDTLGCSYRSCVESADLLTRLQ